MAVQYQDYYATLGVPRDATPEAIRKAYRALARKHHPDVDKTPGATERFQQINEAHEVLKDSEKRKRYDLLGANWQAGQEFTPPPGFEGYQWSHGPGGTRVEFGDLGGMGGFSSFFESLFGGGGPFGAGVQDFEGFERRPRAREGRSHEAKLTIDLEVALRGGTQTFTLHTGRGQPKTYEVKIPAGVTQGSTIRLGGQGESGRGGGRAGDLLLKLEIAEHPRFRVAGHDLETVLRISPWEAALGAKVPLAAADGAELVLSVPPGSSSGRKLRMRGQGLPKRSGERGDLLVELSIAVPDSLTDEQHKLFEELARSSRFDPRT